MESRLYIRSNHRNKGLLPHYFKKAGLVVVLLSIVQAIVLKAFNLVPAHTSKEIFRLLTMNGFILGLLLIAWSRDRIEDEMTIALRWKTMSMAFIWAILSVIIQSFAEHFFKGITDPLSAQGLVVSMLFYYLILYYLQKKGR